MRAAIDAYESRLKELGFVLVPREASEAMVKRAAFDEHGYYPARAKFAREIYPLMIKAVSEEG